ncbi:MAG: uroporphyrinogen-III synthase [Acidobacteriota bacterium]
MAPSVAPALAAELKDCGARVVDWPMLDTRDPESFDALDEAIANLFGYDWLIFRTVNAGEYFLRRFQMLGHDVSEMDALRVCAIGAATAATLEASRVHVDLIPEACDSNSVFRAVEDYLGGGTALGRLNFLVPGASTQLDMLCDLLEEAEARVDVIRTYRIFSSEGLALSQLAALFAGGGIDCVVFLNQTDVRTFAELVDSNDLSGILGGVTVACFDETTAETAAQFDLPVHIIPTDAAVSALAHLFTAGPGQSR